jgi:two-component system, NarL family, response regulator LiaR
MLSINESKCCENCQLLLVEDDLIMQVGISKLFAQHQIDVVYIASDGNTGVDKTIELKPDIVLMDLSLPDLSGIEAIRRIKSAVPNTKVVAISASTNIEQITDAFDSGANAFCVKGTSIEQLKAAITTALGNGIYFDPQIHEKIFIKNMMRFYSFQENSLENYHLSSKEIEVLKLIAQGKDNEEISSALTISNNTIKAHVRSIYGKLGVNNRVEASLKLWNFRN